MTEHPYAPPLPLSQALLHQVGSICSALGRWSAREEAAPSPRLRRNNRIHSIQASLAIERNSLSVEQVSAILEGKPVIGPARDIQEVRNAIAAYEALPRWNPSECDHLLEAHGLLMAGLIDHPGRFRRGGVGIYRGTDLVHMAPPAARVPALIDDLLSWLATSDWHPLLTSSVVHYELEFIHPFADGNGRLGRLWQTLILSRWQPLLAWLPIEEVVRNQQEAYYESLGQADQAGDLTPFASFMLSAINAALEQAIQLQTNEYPQGSEIGSEISSEIATGTAERILELLAASPRLSARRLADLLDLSSRAVEKHMAALQAASRLQRVGSARSGHWQVLDPN
ncbi:MAG: Fic family protein [Synechococcaceae bacterium WB9_4xB_025]|nr:Fic family protein [Synechococcaceae bacterium WB9_4xB_025]